MTAIIPRRVVALPWWPCQLHCSYRQRVYLWRDQVRCLCQLSDGEKYQLSHDIRLDREEYARGTVNDR